MKQRLSTVVPLAMDCAIEAIDNIIRITIDFVIVYNKINGIMHIIYTYSTYHDFIIYDVFVYYVPVNCVLIEIINKVLGMFYGFSGKL